MQNLCAKVHAEIGSALVDSLQCLNHVLTKHSRCDNRQPDYGSFECDSSGIGKIA